MKKTISINISGLVFNIEEQAYQSLQLYLEEIESILSDQEGVTEIIQDIEARIAELFHDRIDKHKEVVTSEDVEEIINIMGNPSQYKIDDETSDDSNQENRESQHIYTTEKRFYRDEDEAVVGGVAAGLAHYLGIDPVIIRIIFVLMFVLGGSGVLLYIILWIVIPSAETTAQKLQMRGQPVNVDNIKNYVHNFKDEAKSGVSNASKSVRNAAKKGSSAFAKILNILGRLMGFGMMILGIILLVVILLVHFGSLGTFMIVDGDMASNLYSLTTLVFPEGSETIGFWALFLAILLPLLFLTTLGIRLLFRLKGRVKTSFITGLVIWIVAISTLAFVGVETGLEFKNDYTYEDQVEQQNVMKRDTLFVKMKDPLWSDQTIDFRHNDYVAIDSDSVTVGFPLIRIKRDRSIQNIKVSVIKRSNGATIKKARSFSEHIAYTSKFSGDNLFIPASYTFPAKDKIRGQFASLLIRVPVGKRIVMPANLDNFPVDFEECEHFSDDFLEEASVWEATEDGMQFVALYRAEGKSVTEDFGDDDE